VIGLSAEGLSVEAPSEPDPGVAGAERGKPEADEPPAAEMASTEDENDEPTPISSVDMAPPQPEIAGDVPRDQVWGQDRPGEEGKSVTALSELIESVTMPASGTEDQESDMTVATDSAEPTEVPPTVVSDPAAGTDATEWGTGPMPTEADPDQMEELPSDRPVPADAIRRASEALDAAVNAAPAVLGPVSPDEDDESVVLVDAEFTHFDGETEPESEPEGAASDYSGRVTDPIPVQSLSAPGVSRETSGSAQMPNGTQQPTGGPHGGDDERRSALIATVPAVDDTTPVAAELAMDARRRIELQGRRFPRPPKTRIITVANQKGGVGKTTTTVNVAAGLAQSGLNVLVIDNDPQGNASTALGIEHRAGTPSVYEILVEGESLASTIQQCPDIPNLWGVPATIDLSGSEIELVSLVSRETRLRKAIDKYLADRIAAGEERIDYVLIDCPPSLGLLTVNAFVAGREVFIPIQCEYYALEGLSQLLKTIDLIRSHLNPELRVSSILLTMYDGRTNLAQQVAGEVRSHFPAETFKTTIPRSVRISEAPSYGQTVMTYDATSTGALAYLQASRELAERGQGGSSPRRAMQAEPVGAQD
jgi:chromosome partitioning protein